MNKLSPMNGNVVLKTEENDEQSYGNIVLPDIGHEKPQMAKVVATSETFNWHTGKQVPSSLKVGDTVLIPKVGAIKVTFNGDDYLMCKETEILATIKN